MLFAPQQRSGPFEPGQRKLTLPHRRQRLPRPAVPAAHRRRAQARGAAAQAGAACRCRPRSTTGASWPRGEVDLVIGNWLRAARRAAPGPADQRRGGLPGGRRPPGASPRRRAAGRCERYLQSEHVAPMAVASRRAGRHRRAPGGAGPAAPHRGAQRALQPDPADGGAQLLVLTTGRLFCSRYVDALAGAHRALPGAVPAADLLPAVARPHPCRAAAALAARAGARRGARPTAGARPPAAGRRRACAERMPPRIALRGDLLDFVATPALGRPRQPGRALPPRPLAADRRRPHRRRAGRRRPDVTLAAHRPRAAGWCCPASSTPMCTARSSTSSAAGAPQLLDWLDTYTFPAEHAHGRPGAWRSRAPQLFLDALLAHGTTAAVVFPTVHKASAEALFDAARAARHAADRRQGADGPPRARRPARRRRTQAPKRDCLDADRALARPRPAAPMR